MSKGKKIALWSSLTVFFLLAVGGGVMLRTYGKMIHAGDGFIGLGRTIGGIGETLHPKEGFPNQDKLTIVCMGIDDNWTNSDVVYTANARTDTLFVLTLDLKNKKATMLSIPRDTYAHIVGTKNDWHFKINAAYTTGGPIRTVATVNEFLGTSANHYMVLNIDATKKMVDAIGGVDVNVENEMHYHDKWGHLSIDLQPGQQHLMGDDAVGYARYRHPDAGKKVTPEDGDERRMYRQHLLLRAMVDKAKTFANVTQAPHLVDVAMGSIRTDLTRQQLFDLAAIFKGVQQSDIKTASIPGDDFRGRGRGLAVPDQARHRTRLCRLAGQRRPDRPAPACHGRRQERHPDARPGPARGGTAQGDGLHGRPERRQCRPAPPPDGLREVLGQG